MPRYVAFGMLVLAACGARGPSALPPQDAARWLFQACGVRFTKDPVAMPNTSTTPIARQGSSTMVSATVVIPEADIASALEALRNNPALHSRGQSDTRYSYQSFPDARPEKDCELDTALHVLYFRYSE